MGRVENVRVWVGSGYHIPTRADLWQMVLLQNQHQQAQQRNTRRDTQQRLDKWLDNQKDKTGVCDGSTLKAVRVWIRGINSAVARVPNGQNIDTYINQLMVRTAVEDLLEEVEGQLNQALPGAVVPHQQILQHVNGAFLGPDEANVLKEDVKALRQGQREDLPRYNRRFTKAADYAYPLPRNPANEEVLTDTYMGSLTKGKVKDRCFNHDPQLVTLQGAMQVTTNEYARQRRRARIQRVATRETEDEPMEVDGLEESEVDENTILHNAPPTLRETMAAMASSLRSLQTEVKTLQQRPPPPPPQAGPSDQPPRSRSWKRGPCFYCKKEGHWKRECRKLKRDMGAQQDSPSQGN